MKGLDYCFDSDIKMARAGGLEPPTPGFGVLCSTRLSYTRVLDKFKFIFWWRWWESNPRTI